jgi:predicted PurR-regulated permease PerM
VSDVSSPALAPVSTPRAGPPAFWGLVALALVVSMLAGAKAILIPLALAIVVAFALGPPVKLLERAVGRVLAVALVVLVALGAATAFGYLLQRQLVDLAGQMVKYSDSMGRKLVALHGEGGALGGLSKSIDRVVRGLDEKVVADQDARPVRVVPAEATLTERIESTLVPAVTPLARALIVLVLTIFLLLKREDIRDRFIRLIGRGHVTLTTRTLDEAGYRISRFLAHQSAINGGFGVVVALGLFAIGIPYAPLWGFVAMVLRFVPFVGSLLAMALPAALAFAQFPGWWQLVATLGLFLGLDVVTAYAVEPVIIGRKTGVSSMAMLVSAIFWSWLWGPVGLVLSTPLTVCLAVLGKYVPRLNFLAVMLGDEPPLEDALVLYHRALSGDEEEAHEILDKRFRASPRGSVFDEVVIPALLLAGRDRARNEISETDHQNVLRTLRGWVDVIPPASVGPGEGRRAAPSRVLGVSARSATDETIWEMFAQLFDPALVAVESVGSAYLTADVSGLEPTEPPDLLVILSIPPGGIAQARYICRRLHAKLPATPILVIRPGVQANGQENALRLTEDGATQVSFTLEHAHTVAEQQLVMGQASASRSPSLPSLPSSPSSARTM